MGLEMGLTIAIILRFVLAGLFVYMFFFFKQAYQKALKDGFKNKFLLGFTFMFLILSIVQTILAFYELFDDIAKGSMDILEQNFPGSDDPANIASWYFLSNFQKYSYIFFVALAALVFAAQIYPLEEIVNWQRTPLTKALVLFAGLTLIILLPVNAIRYSLYSVIVLLAALIAIGLAALLNLGINIKLAFTSTGAIRKRSISVLIGLLLFYFGFIWTLEVGWSKLISPNWGLTEDLILGSLVQMVAAIFYRRGFMQENS